MVNLPHYHCKLHVCGARMESLTGVGSNINSYKRHIIIYIIPFKMCHFINEDGLLEVVIKFFQVRKLAF